jgi:hypothetical protein
MRNWEYYFDQVFNRRDLELKTMIQERIDQDLYRKYNKLTSKIWRFILSMWLRLISYGR